MKNRKEMCNFLWSGKRFSRLGAFYSLELQTDMSYERKIIHSGNFCLHFWASPIAIKSTLSVVYVCSLEIYQFVIYLI